MKKLLEDESKSRLVKTVVLIIPIIMLLTVVFLILNRTSYEKLERKMTKNAKEYIEEKNIKVTNQEFIPIRDLNITDGVDLCSKASGVIITNVAGSIKYYPYLKCTDYESKILKNNDKYIKLKGPEVILINQGTLYSDEGYTKVEKDIKIETVGTVPDEPGAYTINYVVTKNDKQKTIVKRIVIVSDVDTAIVNAEFDKVNEPNLVLKGEKEIVLKVNSKYEEPGYVAYDYSDGYLTNKVSVEPKEISTAKVGKYEITYSVKNSKGKVTTEKRKISVVEKIGDLKIELSTAENGSATNESLIDIHVYGNDFKKIILPDGKESEFTIEKYTVKENGSYTFKVVDSYDNVLLKSIVIDNIDKELPTGSCSVEIGEETIIRVVAKDDRGIQSVDYIINGNETDFLATTTYRTREKVTVVNVIIKDVAGNTASATCPITRDESTETYKFKYSITKKTISCNVYTDNDIKDLENRLATVIKDAGIETRAGVVEAARFLVGGFEQKIPYVGTKNTTIDPDQVLGVYNNAGLNIGSSGWGCTINGLTQGLSPLGFVKWAFINAGLTFDEDAEVTSLNVSKIKPGDLLVTECKSSCAEKYSDIGIVIGVDSSKIYLAEVSTTENGGLVMTELDKNNMPKTGKFSKAIMYNYETEGNLTNMWK